MLKRIKKEYYCFALAGGTGFIIDTGIFTLLHPHVGYEIARIFSISCAMTYCWLINRTFTFKTGKKASVQEWGKYMMTNGIGSLMNLSIFLALCHANIFLKTYYILPLMIATGIAMFWNFTLAKHYVFR